MRSRPPPLAVVVLIAAYAVLFSAVGIRQHDAFLTHKEDLGQIDQAVWNSLHGRLLVETDEDHQSTRLTDHAEPALVLSSLVFLLWDDVRALLAWQALVAALGAWAIFELARDLLVPRERRGNRDEWLAVLFAFVYLMFPALEAAHLAEFHAAPLVTAPAAFALLFLHRRQWRRFVVAALLVVAVKEEMALAGAMLGLAGLAAAWRDANTAAARVKLAALARHPATLVLVVALAWFVLATFVIIPAFGAGKYASGDSVYFQRYGELGATPGAVVRTLLTNPALVWRVVSEPPRVAYLLGLLASVGFFALLALEVLALALPLLFANILSNFPAQYSGDFHYSAPLAPFITVAAVYGFARAARWLATVPFARWALALGLAVIVLFYHRVHGYTPLAENWAFEWPEVTPHHQLFDRFAAQAPPGARLSATPPLFPHLSHREVIYLFPAVADAQYVLLDASGVTDMHPNDFRSAVNGLLSDGAFGVVDSADGYILLRRGAPQTALPDAFYDFARARAPRPQYPLDLVFGDAVRLIGYDIVPDPRWGRVVTRWYWQALRPLDADLTLYPFYHDDAGKLIEDTIQRPMIATVWYPPPRWQVGETIRTETIPWDVGKQFALAVGVVHGKDFDRTGRRLATATGATQIELGRFAWQGMQIVRQAAP